MKAHGTAKPQQQTSTRSCSQLTSAVLEMQQALPSKRNSPLDASKKAPATVRRQCAAPFASSRMDSTRKQADTVPKEFQ